MGKLYLFIFSIQVRAFSSRKSWHLQTLFPNSAVEVVFTQEMRETSYLFQRISIVLQRFNSVLLHDTLPVDLPDLWPSDILILAFLVFNPGDLYCLGYKKKIIIITLAITDDDRDNSDSQPCSSDGRLKGNWCLSRDFLGAITCILSMK